ncbi:MAG: type II toxin-antitoxin system RelE/ParE family toxin [Cyanobacteria bacterium]|nr:type II toxin-antitoxin system RelE/ParE family toxin [Cyanobacteriota bacterium]
MIRWFRCRDTRTLFEGGQVRRFGGVARVALRKLAILDAAGCLNGLSIPPGNRLEALRGNRHGQHRACVAKQCINDQFRICFIWSEAGADYVEFVDYHGYRSAPKSFLRAQRGLLAADAVQP